MEAQLSSSLHIGCNDMITDTFGEPLHGISIDILQVNLGYQCNMACKHCHVEAGPERSEIMGLKEIEAVIGILEKTDIKTIDITGGAPELNPNFHYLVEKAKSLKRHVIIRCNLTIFFETGMDHLPSFYHQNRVEITASLPYFRETNVNQVRGKGAFEKSIKALKILNSLGYGQKDSGLTLNLVHNPAGAFLPPDQSSLEEQYRKELKIRHDIEFNNLYTFTNMPIGRFKDFLIRSNNYDEYMARLKSSFNPDTLDGIMCRHLISVAWDGRLYDCDFNQVTNMPIANGYPRHISEFDYETLNNRKIALGEHCYGCTAGQGST